MKPSQRDIIALLRMQSPDHSDAGQQVLNAKLSFMAQRGADRPYVHRKKSVNRKPKPKREEDTLQIACVKLLRSLPNTLVFSVPNHLWLGSGSNKVWYMVKQKAMGLLAGAPDLVLIFQRATQDPSLLLLELKAPSGTLSDHQKAVQSFCLSIGAVYAVVRSLDDLVSLLRLHKHPSFKTQ